MPTPRIVVFGGTGFLGSHICQAAAKRDCLVESISRSGGPHKGKISYLKGDIFKPEQYRDSLKDAAAVIYSAGMLLEGDYKSLARGEFEFSKVAKLFKSRNPLEADPDRPHGYNALNRDGAILVAKESADAGVSTFAYISAAGNFPGVPSRYITSKREAESAISQIPCLRSLFIRPGLMYSNERPHLTPLKEVVSGIAGINQRLNLPFLGAIGVPPLDVALVARAVIAAILDEEMKGVIDVKDLERLGR